MPAPPLALATRSPDKLREIRQILTPQGFDIVSLSDLGVPIDPAEEALEVFLTFRENALAKAHHFAALTGRLTLADDSGLEVEALGGAPGVRSARYAGERATDADNNAALLAALDALERDPMGQPVADRVYHARFRCVLALVDPYVRDGEPVVVEGVCDGNITRTPRGSGGFGYDPLFHVKGTDKTMAELGADEKNRISHRAKAFEKLRLVLEKTLAERDALTRKVCG